MEPEQPPPTRRVPELAPAERKLIGAVIFGALGVGGLGLYSSFDSVSKAATRWGFDPSWILPVALDVAIPVFSVVYLLLIRMDMALAWVRMVPWVLTLITVYLNVKAAGDDLAAQIGHGALPLLWVVCSEIAAHVYRVLIGAATGRRMERVRRSRWILAPFSTMRLWRRMVLREITSYRVGLKLEEERQLARADLQDSYGRWWWRKTTKRQRVQLRFGEMGPVPVPEAIPGSVPVQVQESPAAELEPAPEAAIAKEPERVERVVVPERKALEPVEPPVEREPERTEQEPERAVERNAGTEREPERRTGTADLTDRATKKEQQVRAVLELVERYGMTKVTPKLVKEQTGIPTTTAFRRIQEARERLERNGTAGTPGTGTVPEQETGT